MCYTYMLLSSQHNEAGTYPVVLYFMITNAPSEF